jgi:beta-fructofuranosidase
MKHTDDAIVSDEHTLNYHLMHPGGDSAPGDPNVAYFLDGTCHLHYILQHPWRGETSYSFVHVTSRDMLHWTWQPTKLQPSFTGHGMFSGTGFITKEGLPAAMYAGVANPRHSFIAIANDTDLSSWQKPYAVVPKGGPEGKDVGLLGDPDCFLVGDTYYAYSAAEGVPMCKSTDLVNWSYVGPFLKYEMPDVGTGEDLSCAHFFPFENKWMLLCISHPMGCRYYLGDWDAETEQFIPEFHGRMNWRRPGQSLIEPLYRDFFAPESVLTPDGRRVMWAWLTTLHPEINSKTVQSLPRELSLAEDGSLRIEPLRELESLRYDAVVFNDIEVCPSEGAKGPARHASDIAELEGDAFEIRISVERQEAERQRFGFLLFSSDNDEGLPILVRPESGTICVGETEAPFAVADLPDGEDVDLRIFVDKYLVEVFVNGRQAALTAHMDYRSGSSLKAYHFRGRDVGLLKIRSIEIWKMKPANQGFLEARESRNWAPDID